MRHVVFVAIHLWRWFTGMPPKGKPTAVGKKEQKTGDVEWTHGPGAAAKRRVAVDLSLPGPYYIPGHCFVSAILNSVRLRLS
jgi:hypothetical protein